MWILTNIFNHNLKFKNSLSFEKYWFYSDEKQINYNNPSDSIWKTFGTISLRKDNINIISSKKNNEKIVSKAFKLYNNEFIHKLKGNYIILHLSSKGFRIYSDRFGIKKFFYWISNTDQTFFICDSLSIISKYLKIKPSNICISNYALLYHFTAGSTIYDNVYHNMPSQVIEFTNMNLSFKTYWNPDNLLKIEKHDIKIDELKNILLDNIKSDIERINCQNVSLSLTGGTDTRNLLALFLNAGINPHLYTYGNPHSNDCIKAAAISKTLKLNHNIYDIPMSYELFKNTAKRIIKLSGGLASIHRVHRLLAIENEKEYSDWMFLGTLGGEFVRGVSHDNYIIPSIIYENWGNEISKSQIISTLLSKNLKPGEIDIDALYSRITVEPFMTGSKLTRKINALSFVTAHLHDAQDINLYCNYFKEVFTPFLDIDYLELLFSSRFSFNNKEILNSKFRSRIDNPVFSANFLLKTYDPLLKFPYSGEHKASEVLFSKYYAALVKKARQLIHKSYPQNFPLGLWMSAFVKKELPLCKEYNEIYSIFDIDALISEMQNNYHDTNEKYWLKFTNPIIMRYIIEEFNS